ncbi:folate-binding protein YgfZ [Hyphomicrobium denitrificans ATCC 51888]|uniref:Folate-binding protein YgfZ n=1 Tax=Hyphomicrobium denitrificans (strain ATCC 51888 / DSM 1869 / NCIMB 11706 / TK 0415) TaxID=582899 RepID=D8JPR1_HYPDA|nr:folate-binding protein YgfZ [Hyphomicrobium denitrificans]ADJ23795.1 folate-binding protein YgfZ [Hyphomicrobium denitrificans ATCC 51888]
MSSVKIARLTDRGVVRVDGADSEKLLQSLVTNEIEGLNAGEARFAGLLSPQGKILFDFFIVRTEMGYLLDVAAAKAADLVKRLTMYKLRADVTITDASPGFAVYAVWDDGAAALTATRACVHFNDPRHPAMGVRWLMQSPPPADAQVVELAHIDYDALRVRLGVPEAGKDFEFGDAYPHEADYDLFNGVSFTKGCYVGQEIVARMQNKTVVRKRVVKISATAPLISGAEIHLGDVAIGRVGTVDGLHGLAMVRLDRAIEAQDKNQRLRADGIAIDIDADAAGRYRKSAAARPSAALPS